MLFFNTMPMKTLLLDAGGTFIKCSDGREIPIRSDGSREEISSSFAKAVGAFCNEDSCVNDAKTACGKGQRNCEIAVAIPGPFDYERGIFLMKHKFSSVYGMSFREVADVPSCARLLFTHDVNVMLAGEMFCGNGRGYSRVALVALGTGLGFAMSIDGHILKKATGSPLVSIFGLPYRDGILEDYASKRGFLGTFQALGGQGATTVKDIAEFASDGDKAALETFRSIGSTIARTISPILKEYGIECLLFGGQISRSFRFLEPALREGLSGVESLVDISQVSNFDNATFNGLRAMLRQEEA